MSKLVDFYKNILESLGLVVDQDGAVYLNSENIKRPLMIDGLPVYLPTDEAIRTSTTIENGSVKPVKILFNPLAEDSIKGENKSFNKLKDIMELKLLGVIYQLGESLFNIIADKKSDITDMEVVRFVSLLNSYKAPGIKQIIDTKTIEIWANMYSAIVNNGAPKDMKYVRFYIKKGGKINDIKYNRVGVITYPFIENLKELPNKQTEYLGVKFRKKDKHVMELFFEFLFGKLDDVHNQFGSLNQIAPATHVLLLMYGHIVEKLVNVIGSLLEIGVEDDVAKRLDIKPLSIQLDTLGDFIDSLKGEIKRVPLEGEVSQPAPTAPAPAQNTSVYSNQSAQQTPQKQTGGSFWDRVGSNEAVHQPQQSVYNQAQPAVNQVQPVVNQVQPVYNQAQPVVNQVQPTINRAPIARTVVGGQQQYPQQAPQVQRPMVMNNMMDDPWATNQQPAGYNPYVGAGVNMGVNPVIYR